MPCYAMLCYAVLCYVTLYYGMLCCAVPYYVVLCPSTRLGGRRLLHPHIGCYIPTSMPLVAQDPLRSSSMDDAIALM